MTTHYINGQWRSSGEESLVSYNPATNLPLWQGQCATGREIELAVDAASAAFKQWRDVSLHQRLQYLRRFNQILTQKRQVFARLISAETGKPRWDALGEVNAAIAKLDISLEAFEKRTWFDESESSSVRMELRHKPIGVMAIIGPYNFPCHLPNGQILPALIAGNTLVFKPSELTPATAEFMVKCWQEAELPAGVVNLVQGDGLTGKALLQDTRLAAVMFTGSEGTGKAIHRSLAGRPEVLLALEMGGNNPLIVEKNNYMQASVNCVLESAYISAGQRCTCTRRLLLPVGAWGDEFLQNLVSATRKLVVGAPDDSHNPFMGCLISVRAAQRVLAQQQRLLNAGASGLLPCESLPLGEAFLSPGILDVTGVGLLPDEEVFGPLLQVIRYQNLEQAIAIASQTRFGLAAGLLSESELSFDLVLKGINAGIVNWNRPTTGASGAMPFGGVGSSGNHRPAAFYTADACSYPVASMLQPQLDKLTASRYLSPNLEELGA